MTTFQRPDASQCAASAAPAPRVLTIDLRLAAQTQATGMQGALERSPKIKLRKAVLGVPQPKVVSLAVSRQEIKTTGFAFPALVQWLTGHGAEEQRRPACPTGKPPRKPAGRCRGRTRLQPPGDVIKLQDRLHFVLQPPLESWMSSESLEFPFDPFPYQFEGIAFLYPRHAAVLADEMGLGKTMQAISTIRLLLHTREINSVLLVCPKPLVTNWRREFELWAPETPVLIIEGDQARRRWQWSLPAPVKIANYELLQRDRGPLLESGLRFDLVALDESQRIKNRASATSQIVRAISRSRSWALTGTPVENSAEDLVGIFEFIAPGYLNSNMKLSRMGREAGEFVLRRTKDKVLTDMPPKLFRDVDVELLPEQRETYRLAEENGVLRLTEMGDSATIQHVFELVLRLKQICNFDSATGASAKLERLAADLEEVAQSGKKAIVFSQWVTTLSRLAHRLQRFGPLEYHGKIPSKKRDGVIQRFRDDPSRSVILMSYGAGGVGLNLQFCEYVFLFDRWWNPAIEDQAINRAHRIGAAGPVTVSRFLTPGTIEQRIDQVLQEKRELFDAIFSGGEVKRNLGLTQDEVFGLFQLRSPSGPLRAAA